MSNYIFLQCACEGDSVYDLLYVWQAIIACIS